MSKVLVTIPVKANQLISIFEEKNIKMLYIAGRKCMVSTTQEDPKKPTRYVATIVFNDLMPYVQFASKLNARGIEFYYTYF